MVKAFTAITTMGVCGIPVAGHLMDTFGFVWTAAVTITLSVVYSAGLLWTGSTQLLVAFVAYALFRTFLFTYFFAYLADALGFKYFGVLAGVAFFMAGVVGLLQSPLLVFGAGTCHQFKDPLTEDCSTGNWQYVNVAQLVCLVLLYIIPILDARSAARKNSLKLPTTSVNIATRSPAVSGKKYATINTLTTLQEERPQNRR